MHHLKETTIDGMKFVLIPEELHDALVLHIYDALYVMEIKRMWLEFDPEVFNDVE